VSQPIALLDPFTLTPNTAAYVPRAATERALAQLLQSVRLDRRPVAITGPTGLGKTLLLHLLAERVRGALRPVYLPYAALSVEDLCTWVLTVLDAPGTDDPLAAFEASVQLQQQRGCPLLLIIDDAGTLPLGAARWIGDCVERASGGLRLAVAAADEATAGRTIAALGARVRNTRLTAPLRRAEMLEYVTRRLALAGVPESIRARFDKRTVLRLHSIAGGNPRRMHIAASSLLRGGPLEVPEDWIVDAGAATQTAPPGPGESAALSDPDGD
jgi:MSHA biogenesis protein MshM